MKKHLVSFSLFVATLAMGEKIASGQIVELSQPTATYSQYYSGAWTVGKAIDKDLVNSGWAVQHENGFGAPETAVFETVRDVGFPGGTELTFRFSMRGFSLDGPHNLGRFRLSVTSDDRSEFADGLDNNGDVTANWEVLNPITFQAGVGAILSRLEDGSILASGPNTMEEGYTITAQTLAPRITGIRLETLADPSLPGGGPGRSQSGNFILRNFAVFVQPSLADLQASIQVSTVSICWPGRVGRQYQIQYSSSLTTNEWVNFGTPVAGNGANCVADEVRSQERRFYRVTLASP